MLRDACYKTWGGMPIPGERSVANFDEDSVTMAMESAIDCMRGIDPQKVDGLFFATTTSPYKEKLCASIMATALDMRRDIRTMDVTGTLRVGTTAIAAAIEKPDVNAIGDLITKNVHSVSGIARTVTCLTVQLG